MSKSSRFPPAIEVRGGFSFEDADTRPQLGKCCACDLARATHIVMVNRRCAIAGHGWGCVVCGVPPDGAHVVVCHDCWETRKPIRFACRGYPASEGRQPIAELAEGFDHDHSKHSPDD